MAIKVQKLTQETQALIVEEFRVLRDFAGHPNLPEFYGIYRKRSGKKSEPDQVWFVMEVNIILFSIILLPIVLKHIIIQYKLKMKKPLDKNFDKNPHIFLEFCLPYWNRHFEFRKSDSRFVIGDPKNHKIPIFIKIC